MRTKELYRLYKNCNFLKSSKHKIEISNNNYETSYFNYKTFCKNKKTFHFYKKRVNIINKINYIKNDKEYNNATHSIPIPCFDIAITTWIRNELRICLIKRKNWPMYHSWWLIGGRRVLSEVVNEDIDFIDEINWKIYTDLLIKPKHIVSYCKLVNSDHYHYLYQNNLLINKRLTPTETYLVELLPESINSLQIPDEAIHLQWFTKNDLITLLKKNKNIFSDHIKIILFLIFDIDSQLLLKY